MITLRSLRNLSGLCGYIFLPQSTLSNIRKEYKKGRCANGETGTPIHSMPVGSLTLAPQNNNSAIIVCLYLSNF